MSNKIILKKNSIVYVLAPANTLTGGPELLHQFAHHFFKIFKIKTKMVYLPMDQKNLVHKNFKKYKVSYSSSIIDLLKTIENVFAEKIFDLNVY